MARDNRATGGQGPLEYQLYSKDKQIWDSDQRIRKMQDQMRFTTNQPSREVPTDISAEIARSMTFLEAEVDSIIHASCVLSVPSDIQPGLASLIRSICDWSKNGSSENRQLRSWALKFEPGILIKTLTLAGLREWVFNTAYPQFAEKDAQLLRAYRSAVMLQGQYDPMTRHNLFH